MGPEFMPGGAPPLSLYWCLALLYALAGAWATLSMLRLGAQADAVRGDRRLRAAAASGLAVTTWCVTVLALAAVPLPLVYRPFPLAVALLLPALAAYAALPAVGDAAPPRRLPMRLAGGLLLATGLLAVPVLAVVAMDWRPPPGWNPALLLTAGVFALATAGVLLFVQAHLRGAQRWQLLRTGSGALTVAALLSAMEAAALAATDIPAEAIAGPAWALARDSVTLLALVGGPAVLALLCCAAALEARLADQLGRARSALRQAETTDTLTRLPNRRHFEAALQAAAMRADREQRTLAVLCINLDALKHFNESFGAAVGDALLCGVAQRLRRLAGAQDLLARASGDEFLLMLGARPDREAAARVAGLVIAEVGRSLLLDAREVSPSASVGIAMYPEDGTMAALLPRAAAAMRHAKRNGPGSFGFFEAHMVEGVRDNVDLLRDLRHAIERRELVLYYQPKVDTTSGDVTGAEALLRWQHPTRGLVHPVHFIPLAERAGMIGVLGNWVIDEACRQMQAWRQQGQRVAVSVNLSVHQLRQPDLLQRIRAALVRHQIEPMQLTCEITESAAMDDTGATLALVKELASAGVRIAIDDFGTGYSSLTYLRRLPATELKIDRSFVIDLHGSVDARAIVDAVIKLAHALGLRVVAEGVETEAQRTILRHLGCDELQGYLFAKPMGARMLQTWVDDGVRPTGAAGQASGTPLASKTVDTVRGVRLSPQQGVKARLAQPPA